MARVAPLQLSSMGSGLAQALKDSDAARVLQLLERAGRAEVLAEVELEQEAKPRPGDVVRITSRVQGAPPGELLRPGLASRLVLPAFFARGAKARSLPRRRGRLTCAHVSQGKRSIILSLGKFAPSRA